MQKVGIREAEGRLRDLIEDAIQGHEILIVKSSSQAVKLVPGGANAGCKRRSGI